ncbi:DUF1768 domain-containing protein [Patescibacteria group bacterium]|nr:DUF1768 domain-containing protein [Patescibacteria group bacterium]
MWEICCAKLNQHEYVQRSLERSGSVSLIEDSPMDSSWGRDSDWSGENALGKIWMELREAWRP